MKPELSKPVLSIGKTMVSKVFNWLKFIYRLGFFWNLPPVLMTFPINYTAVGLGREGAVAATLLCCPSLSM